MEVRPTRLPGLLTIEPTVHGDDRGFFVETFRASVLGASGVDHVWVQDNHSRSTRGVCRGMHFALPPGQAKLVRCARGAIVDVCVDIRHGSPTFGEWEAIALDDQQLRMVYVPVGFAHGYMVTSDVADVVYKCSGYYSPEAEREISAVDPDLGITWPDLPMYRSARDTAAPTLREIVDTLPFTFSG